MKALHSTHASAKGSFDNIAMNGQEVFKFAVRAVPTVGSAFAIQPSEFSKIWGVYQADVLAAPALANLIQSGMFCSLWSSYF